MGFTDDELLDFDHERLAHFSPARAERQLAEQGDVYRAQLVAARWIDGWRKRNLENPSPISSQSDDWHRGHDAALRDVIAHLRQGDLIPGGVLYEDEVSGRSTERRGRGK